MVEPQRLLLAEKDFSRLRSLLGFLALPDAVTDQLDIHDQQVNIQRDGHRHQDIIAGGPAIQRHKQTNDGSDLEQAAGGKLLGAVLTNRKESLHGIGDMLLKKTGHGFILPVILYVKAHRAGYAKLNVPRLSF